MKRLVTLMLVASLAVGCGHDSTSGSNPPADHGGYSGKAAHWYDAAYSACYRQVQMMMNKPVSAGETLTYDRLATQLIPRSAFHYMKAINAGCFAGARKVGGAAGLMGSTYGSTNP